MDRQNVKPNRPSLLANGDTWATDRAPGAGRILTDAEQGTSRGATARSVRRRPLVMVVGAAVAVLGALFAWHAFDNAPHPNAVAETSSLSTTSSALPNTANARVVEPTPASTAASDTATIVNADNPFGGSSTPRATDPNPFGEITGSQRPIKRPNPFATTHASTERPDSASKHMPAKRVVPVTAATHQRTSAKAAPSTPAKTGTEVNETALGNSLLGNIDPDGLVAKVNAVPSTSVPVTSTVASRSSPSVPMGNADGAKRSESKLIRPQTDADHEALESLIQQVDALQSQAGAAAGVKGATAMSVAPENSSSPIKKTTAQVNHVDREKPLTRTEQLQRDLHRCPRANTTSGVDCRIKVCRNYGGKDPACATKH